MGRLTPYAANLILNELCGKTNTLDFGTIYVGLATAQPTISGDTVTDTKEITISTTTGYKRVLIGAYNQTLTQLMGTPSGGSVTNTSVIKFEEVLASWGTATHFLIFNAPTGGQLLAYGELVDDQDTPTSITPTVGSIPIIRAGGLTISIT